MVEDARIDAHQHLWRLTEEGYGWIRSGLDLPGMADLARDFLPADYLALSLPHGITETILVEADMRSAETEAMLAFARDHAFIRGVVGWADLEAVDALDRLDRLRAEPKFVGLRLWLLRHADPDWVLNPAQSTPLARLERDRICLDMLARPAHLDALSRLLDRHPGLRVVLNHGAKPEIGTWTPGNKAFRDWEVGLKRLAAQGCHMKISGVLTESGQHWTKADVKPYVDSLIGIFGPNRCIWGSDWPVINRGGGFDKWLSTVEQLTAHLEAVDRAAIFGETARRFYLGT